MAKLSVAPSTYADAWSTLSRRRESNSSMVHGSRTPNANALASGSVSSDDEDSGPVPLAATTIPGFRRCRPHSSSYDEATHRRRRTVVSDSENSTNSASIPRLKRNGSTSLSSFGSCNALDELEDITSFVAPPLPPSPYPVDPYHFYCTGSPSLSMSLKADATNALMQQIREVLEECDIEFKVQPFKCKFKCVKYVQYSHVEFVIRAYTAANGKLLLEFQRRTGSLLLWDGLYSVLYHRLLQWVDTAAPACSQSGTQKKVAPREQDSLSVKVWKKLSASVQAPTSGVEAMKIMVSSSFADAQREGCAGLAIITKDSASAFLVARFGIVEFLVRAAASDDLDMARCAIGSLGNIARALGSFPDQKLAALTLDEIKHATHIVVKRLGNVTDSLFSLELLRECARALCSFGKICPRAVVVCDGTLQLQHHMNHRDPQLSTLCRDALRELEANV
jgi:hypothetical protein